MSEWFEFRPGRDDFAPTALDCSRFIEAPTGRHGFVGVRGDGFAFEDGTPARFWGAQIHLGSTKEDIDYVARRLRRQGINIVRRHGLRDLLREGARSAFDYHEERLDLQDYLRHRLGQEASTSSSTSITACASARTTGCRAWRRGAGRGS